MGRVASGNREWSGRRSNQTGWYRKLSWGPGATTLSLPFVSEIYWLIDGWLDHRYFAVLYSLRIALYLSWWMLIFGLFVISSKMEERRLRRTS